MLIDYVLQKKTFQLTDWVHGSPVRGSRRSTGRDLHSRQQTGVLMGAHSPGMATNVFFVLTFLDEKIIDLPYGQINDPSFQRTLLCSVPSSDLLNSS